MRLCMVTTYYPPSSYGGDATYVQNLSEGLAARGHEIEVVCCQDAFELHHRGPSPSPARPDPPGVTVHRLKSPAGWLSPLITQQTGRPGLKSTSLRRIMDRGRFDVVNFHNISLVGGPGVLHYSRAPLNIYTLHEHWLICPTHILWKDAERACDRPTCFSCCLRSGVPPQPWRYSSFLPTALAEVDCLISPSPFTAERHRAAGITQPIKILPLFSTFEAIRPGSGRDLVEKSTFLVVGRVTPSKGLAGLLRRFADWPRMNLVIIGDGDQREMLERQYGELPNITFLGRLPQRDLAGHYARATALILPSIAPETFGLGVVEAAACGTPALVAGGSGGAVDTINLTGGGRVYANETELQAILEQLVTEPGLRAELGAAARAGYERYYTLDRHLDNYEALIAQMTASRGSMRASVQ